MQESEELKARVERLETVNRLLVEALIDLAVNSNPRGDWSREWQNKLRTEAEGLS